MEQPQNGPVSRHWSVRPWKLVGVLAAAIAVLDVAYLELTLLLLSERMSTGTDPTGQVAWSLLLMLLLAAYMLLGGAAGAAGPGSISGRYPSAGAAGPADAPWLEARLWPWVVLQPLQSLFYALVAAALLTIVRRLWDTLALQWVLLCLLNLLGNLWRPNTVGAVPAGLGDTHRLILWAIPAVVSLYCVLLWDRRVSPARPFITFAQRIKALAGRYLPL